MNLGDFGSVASIISLVFGFLGGFAGCKFVQIGGKNNKQTDKSIQG